MWNEIWSLVSYVRALSWFVTLSPADNKHPICLYFADTDEEFKPDIRLPDDTFRLVANNPAAAARFFDYEAVTKLRLVLQTRNSQKIQCDQFYESVFPTVSNANNLAIS